MAATPSGPPIRLVVADDLAQSRATVLLRLLLVLPHLVVVALWGAAALAVAVVLWLALLVEGRAPHTLQSFVSTYLRYSVQVAAYLYLAAGPYPSFGGRDGYPVDVEIELSPRQSRLGAGFRIVLGFPTLLLAAAAGGGSWIAAGPFGLRGGGGLAATAAFLAWFVGVARGRVPRSLRDLALYGIGYTAQAGGYLLLVTDRYPTSDPARVVPGADAPHHPVRLVLASDARRSRLTVFFRLLLTLPHLIWISLWTALVAPAALAAWLAALVTGRVPGSLHRFLAAWVRYSLHVGAFVFLIGGPFPGFLGAAGSYPVDLDVDGPERQHRARTLFRLILVVPALALVGAYTAAVWIVGILGWWAALVTGRMPDGLCNLGAVALRFTAQTNAYTLMLTDRYPCPSPALPGRPTGAQLEVGAHEPSVAGSAGIEPA